MRITNQGFHESRATAFKVFHESRDTKHESRLFFTWRKWCTWVLKPFSLFFLTGPA